MNLSYWPHILNSLQFGNIIMRNIDNAIERLNEKKMSQIRITLIEVY